MKLKSQCSNYHLRRRRTKNSMKRGIKINLVEEIKSLFEKAPNDFEKIRVLLSSREFTKEELADMLYAHHISPAFS